MRERRLNSETDNRARNLQNIFPLKRALGTKEAGTARREAGKREAGREAPIGNGTRPRRTRQASR